MRAPAFLLTAVFAAMLSACGYKGPLYLPKPQPETQAGKQAPAQGPQQNTPPEPVKP